MKQDISGQGKGYQVNDVYRIDQVGDRYYGSDGPREITVSGVGGTPPNFEKYWVDRSSYQSLLTHRIATLPVTEIVAIGGFGKSSLAAWAYANLQGDFKKRLWIDFREPPTFRDVVRWILQEIGIRYDVQKPSPETLLKELLYRLNDPNTPVKTLVVLDNLESIADQSDRQWFEQFLRQWAADGKVSRVLVTTRSQVLSQEPIALVGFDGAEGETFLERERLTGDRFSELIGLTGGHPLLLKLAASWTRETYESQVDDRAIDFFIKLFANYKGDPKAGVSAIFDVIFEALPIGLQELLCRVSVYRLPFDEAMAIAMQPQIKSLQEETLKNFNIDLRNTFLEATKTALQALCDRGLLLSQDDRFVLHPLVAGLVRSRVTEEVRWDGHEKAIGFYEANYQAWDGTIESCRSELEGFYHACELGQYNRALQILERCYEILNVAGEWRSLLPLYKRLTCEWQASDDTEVKNLGFVWTRLGIFYRDLGDVQSAIDSHLQARLIFDRLDSTEGNAVVLCNLSNTYFSHGDYQKSINLYSQSIKRSQALGSKGGIAKALSGLGIVSDALGDYQKAIDFHSQHNELAQAIGDKQGIAASLNNLGNAYQSLGDYQKAIDFHSQSLEIAQAISYKQGIAASLNNLGNGYYSLGNSQKSIDFHSQSLEIAQAIGYKNGIANSLGGLGNAHYSLGDYQKAIDVHSQSLEVKQSIGDQSGIANSLWNLSGVYQQSGRLKLSMHYRHRAYRIWQDMNLPLAATPYVDWSKNLSIDKGDTWAEQLIASEKSMAWLMLPIDYLLFTLRILLSPLTQLQTRLKIQPKIFWFCVGIAIVLVIAWLKK